MLRPVPRLVLASTSPRRASVLRQLGLDFEVVAPDVDETIGAAEGPGEAAERLARAKAERGARPGAIAFGFDTVVAHDGRTLGKPASEEEARETLARLSGAWHVVFSGIAAAVPGRTESATCRTRVRFRALAEEDIATYVETGEPMDKAGAYGIQGAGASLVEGIDGDFFNVMGFPIPRFLELLARFGLRYDFGALVSAAAVGDG